MVPPITVVDATLSGENVSGVSLSASASDSAVPAGIGLPIVSARRKRSDWVAQPGPATPAITVASPSATVQSRHEPPLQTCRTSVGVEPLKMISIERRI